MNQTKTNYSGDYEAFADLKSQLDRYHGDDMYRMELTDLRTRMDPAWYNYYGLSTFSSMASEKLSNLQSHLGIYGNFINSYTYNPQTPVYNAMTALQYVVKKVDSVGLENTDLYKPILANEKFEAYENQYCLPVAFCVSELVENWNDTDSNPFTVQSDFFRRAAFAEGVYSQMTVTNVSCDNLREITEEEALEGQIDFNKLQSGEYGAFTVTISPLKTQNCYLYVKSSSVDTIYVNGDDLNLTQNIDEAYILDLGVLEAGEEVDVEIPVKDDADSGSVKFYMAGLEMDVFRQGFETLQNGALQIRSFEERRIEGTAAVNFGQILFTSIPYDDGWRIYVDGQRVPRTDYLRIGDALLAIRIAEGDHEIVMEYEPVGMSFSVCVSACTLAFLLLGLLLADRRRKKARALPVTPRVEYIEEFPGAIEVQPGPEPIVDPQPDGFFLSEIDETPQTDVPPESGETPEPGRTPEDGDAQGPNV
jgi:uncharacterized membrane protein YfhO